MKTLRRNTNNIQHEENGNYFYIRPTISHYILYFQIVDKDKHLLIDKLSDHIELNLYTHKQLIRILKLWLCIYSKIIKYLYCTQTKVKS